MQKIWILRLYFWKRRN